jgi:phage virion morphogenesis protein
MQIRVDADDFEEAFQALAQRTADLRPALRSIGEYLLLETRDRYDAGVDPQGRPWAPLAAATIAQKQRDRTPFQKVLLRYGTLRETLTYEVTGQTLAVGSPQAYAVYHQFGTKNMPQRQILGLSQADRAEILEIVRAHLA